MNNIDIVWCWIEEKSVPVRELNNGTRLDHQLAERRNNQKRTYGGNDRFEQSRQMQNEEIIAVIRRN